MYSILLVEDSPEYVAIVERTLSSYKVISTDDPDAVRGILERNKIQLILLDINLPKRDGYSVLDEIQTNERFNSIPVICLTGKDQVSDKVTAFSLGADDYIQKPINVLEFKARIDARLKKSARLKHQGAEIAIGELVLDVTSHRLLSKSSGPEIRLTQTEFKLLLCLAKNIGQVFSREQLLNLVWGTDETVFDRAVDVHICSLRKKLLPYKIQFKSITGLGYCMQIRQPEA